MVTEIQQNVFASHIWVPLIAGKAYFLPRPVQAQSQYVRRRAVLVFEAVFLSLSLLVFRLSGDAAGLSMSELA